MHTIEEAAVLVIRDTMRWMNANFQRQGWMNLNFDGVFLFHCIHFKRTAELSGWRAQRMFKTKALRHNFDGSCLSEIKFYYPDERIPFVDVVNKALERALKNATYWEMQEWRPEVTIVPAVLTPRPVFGTFPTLENFKFTPKEERILVTV